MKKERVNQVRRTSYKKALPYTKPEFSFRLPNGQKIKNLFVIATAFDKMPDGSFCRNINDQRINDQRNNFAIKFIAYKLL